MTVTTPPAQTTGFLRRNLIWFVVAFALVLTVAVTAWTQTAGPEHNDRLDPENFGADGARALAQVLDDQGVEVTIARTADALEAERVGRDTTVVVTGSHRLAQSTTDRLFDHTSRGRLVLVEPPEWVTEHATDAGAPVPADADGLRAECRAHRGLELRVDRAVAWEGQTGGCFATDGARILAEPDRRVVLFGAGDALTNDQVLRADNAAIALRLLGADERLVWYLPTFDDIPVDETAGLRDLLPDWIIPGLWMGLAAGIALVLWRFRRLGPLSTEPLPVVVRAIETARSRGRMYHHSNDRAHAASALRRASRRRAAEKLRLGRRPEEKAVIAAVADHLGLHHADVARLLASDAEPPATDEEFLRLAADLAQLDSFDEQRPDRP